MAYYSLTVRTDGDNPFRYGNDAFLFKSITVPLNFDGRSGPKESAILKIQHVFRNVHSRDCTGMWRAVDNILISATKTYTDILYTEYGVEYRFVVDGITYITCIQRRDFAESNKVDLVFYDMPKDVSSCTYATIADDPDAIWVKKFVRVLDTFGNNAIGTFVKRDGTAVLLKDARFVGCDVIHDLIWVQYLTLRLPRREELDPWKKQTWELSNK